MSKMTMKKKRISKGKFASNKTLKLKILFNKQVPLKSTFATKKKQASLLLCMTPHRKFEKRILKMRVHVLYFTFSLAM